MFDEVERLINSMEIKKKEYVKITITQRMNEISKQEKTAEQWKDWAYLNRIIPCEIGNVAEDKKIITVSNRYGNKCDGDCHKCLSTFFDENIKYLK